jgi:hypothetical protein
LGFDTGPGDFSPAYFFGMGTERAQLHNNSAIGKTSYFEKVFVFFKKNGAPGVIRTRDPRIRSPMLYPAELRAHSLEFSTILEN